MYYVTTTQNVGPNQSDARNNYGEPIACVSTEAPRTNMSGEIRTDGWLGQNNDVTSHAWGEFETIEAARAFCHEQGWTAEHEDEDNDPDCEYYTTAVAIRAHWDAGDWFQSEPNCGMTGAETDAEIETLAEKLDAEAIADQDVELCGTVDYLMERRDMIRARQVA